MADVLTPLQSLLPHTDSLAGQHNQDCWEYPLRYHLISTVISSLRHSYHLGIYMYFVTDGNKTSLPFSLTGTRSDAAQQAAAGTRHSAPATSTHRQACVFLGVSSQSMVSSLQPEVTVAHPTTKWNIACGFWVITDSRSLQMSEQRDFLALIWKNYCSQMSLQTLENLNISVKTRVMLSSRQLP